MDKHLSYWESSVAVEEFTNWHSTTEHIHKLSLLGNYMYDKESSSVLDCGAGNGSLYKVLEGLKLNIKYKGIDLTQKLVTDAQNNMIDIEYGDIEQIQFKDESYDMVVATDVITHLYDYRSALKEMLRVAKRHVVFTTFKPSIQSLKYIFPEQRPNIIGWYPGKWDRGNLPVTCPRLGFYPGRTRHSGYIQTVAKEKTYASPFGFYKHARKDEQDNPILIHHYYDIHKLYANIKSIAKENNTEYKINYSFSNDQTRLRYLQYYSEMSDKEKNEVPHISAYADMFYIDKEKATNG
jgi:hypothetical protein